MKPLALFVLAVCSSLLAACRSNPVEQPPADASSARETPGDLTARSLTIVDDAGRPRLRMAVESNVAPSIEFLDQAGEPVASAALIDAQDDRGTGSPSPQGFLLHAEIGDPGHIGNFVVTKDAIALVMTDDDEQGISLTLSKGAFRVGLSCKDPHGAKAGATIDLDVILALEDGRLVVKTEDGNVLGSFAVPTTRSKDRTSSTGKVSVSTRP